MAIRVAINHKTNYRFDRPVKASPHVVRLRPAPHTRTPIESYSLKVLPKESLYQLAAGSLRQLPRTPGVPRAGAEMSFEVDLVAEIVTINPFDFFVEEYASITLSNIPRVCARNWPPTWKSPRTVRAAKMAGGRRPVPAGDQ